QPDGVTRVNDDGVDIVGNQINLTTVGGGPVTEVIPSVYRRHFALTRRGIYYVPFPAGHAGYELHYLDLGSSRSRRLAALPYQLHLQLSTAPDGLTLLFGIRSETESDLMLVEPFE
ncbi:MAG: hypothetical protein GY953_42725, partial [bacterium]|nr:hypothetical protein [bacterium]